MDYENWTEILEQLRSMGEELLDMVADLEADGPTTARPWPGVVGQQNMCCCSPPFGRSAVPGGGPPSPRSCPGLNKTNILCTSAPGHLAGCCVPVAGLGVRCPGVAGGPAGCARLRPCGTLAATAASLRPLPGPCDQPQFPG